MARKLIGEIVREVEAEPAYLSAVELTASFPILARIWSTASSLLSPACFATVAGAPTPSWPLRSVPIIGVEGVIHRPAKRVISCAGVAARWGDSGSPAGAVTGGACSRAACRYAAACPAS
jgi:hypothetical protein